MIIIYEAKNKFNNKKYYGQTKLSLNKRKIEHLKECKKHNLQHLPFKRALVKYSIDGFEWNVLKKCSTKDEADKWEKYYIGNNIGGYNVAAGGIGGIIHLTPELEKARVDKILKTKSNWSKEYKDKIYSFTKTVEFRNGVSNRMSGSGNYWYGKKGYWGGKQNKEHSERMKGIKKGPMSEETKLKLSTSTKGKQKTKRKFYTLKHDKTNAEKTLSNTEWVERGVDIGHLYRNNGKTNKGKKRTSKGWYLIHPLTRK